MVQATYHETCLTHDHVMGFARDIDRAKLQHHLVVGHNISMKNVVTRGQMGKLHLLVHAVIAHPDLRELLELPDNYGTGRHSKVKY